MGKLLRKRSRLKPLERLTIITGVVALLLCLIQLEDTTSSSVPCWRGATSKLQFTSLPSTYQLSDFMEGPGLNHTDNACKFVVNERSPHWPHAMQQLYRCFSFWKSRNFAQPYLVLPKKQPMDGPFMREFIDRLRDVFGVRVVYYRGDLKVVRSILDDSFETKTSFALRHADDVAHLRESIRKWYQIRGSACSHKSPRIGILNRESTRQLLNADAITQQLQRKKYEVYSTTFENRSFSEQIHFLSKVDILISPHGAQLTSLPFLNRCSGVLELFPGGYSVPNYFGTLAAVSNISHAHLYLGKNQDAELRHYMKDRQSRDLARTANVCPSPNQIVDAVPELERRYRECCNV